MNSEEIHKKIRQYRPPAFADFMDEVYLSMSVDLKSNLPADTMDYINAIVSYALNNLDKFGNSLAKAIYGVYVQSPTGERFILDPKRTKSIVKATLFLDSEDNIISLINPTIEWVKEDKSEKNILVLKHYQSYEILTGNLRGNKFDNYSRPIPTDLKKRSTPIQMIENVTKSLRKDKPIQIFLCHASEDKESVRNLYKKLKTSGYSPWLDEEELLPGQDWNREIQLAIKNSDVILICLSTRSEKRGFVQKEIVKALDIAEEFPEGSIFIIPVKFEQCSVPLRLNKWQWVDLWENGGYEKLQKSLNKKSYTNNKQEY